MRVSFESIDEAERIANRRLPHKVQHFVRTGVGQQRTLRRNLDAYAGYALRNRIFTDVSQIDTGVEILGARYAAPVFLAPTGLQGIVWPEGELAMAKAAASRNVGLAVSANAAYSLEDVARAHGTGPDGCR